MKIYLGRSLAGHDKNHIYVVHKEEDNFLVLVNGDTKTIAKPKRKNKVHVQLIKHLPEVVESKIKDIDGYDDKIVRDIINTYNDYLNK